MHAQLLEYYTTHEALFPKVATLLCPPNPAHVFAFVLTRPIVAKNYS